MTTAYLLVGLTGSGKTTYARRELEPRGVVRLSVDEIVFERHGRYGVDYAASDYLERYDAALAEVRDRARLELRAGRDVALDLGIWSRSDRDDWKRLVEEEGAAWRMLFFDVSRTELVRRLATRNLDDGANALPVHDADLDDFYERFEAPSGEGEEIVGS